MNNSPNIPVEDRKYVLRFVYGINNNQVGGRRYTYYTGGRPTPIMSEAKIFSLGKAKATKQFAHTGRRCEVKRVTDMMLFKAALEGK